MGFFTRYSVVIGGLALVLVVTVLVSVPSDILALQATFIGTELQYGTESETRVLTKMDFGKAEHMRAFPKRFGDWLGLDFEPSDVAVRLGADVLLVRTYLNTSYYQAINFVIMQAREPSSFHPPPICYRASGWEVEEECVEVIPLSGAAWTRASEPTSISAKKLVAVKTANGEVDEREVALYFYVKGGLFEDTVTMVQVYAAAPLRGSYAEVLESMRGFLDETVPYMFELGDEEEGEVLAIHLARSWGGRVLMGILVLIPLVIMAYPRVRRL